MIDAESFGDENRTTPERSPLTAKVLEFQGEQGPRKEVLFEEIWDEVSLRIRFLARRILRNETLEDEAVQEVGLILASKLQTFHGGSNFQTWLHRVTVNAALGQRRKEARWHRGLVASPFEDIADDLTDVEKQKKQEEAEQYETHRQLLVQEINELPFIYGLTVTLADLEGLTNKQIAEVMSCNEPAVKSRLHRARKQLKAALAPEHRNVMA